MKKSNKYVLTNNQINLISDIEKILDVLVILAPIGYYIDITINYILNTKCMGPTNDNDEIFAFTINYNDFKYEYTIKLDNNVLSFEVKLKDNRISSIILSKTTDFNILIQFMLNNDN